MAPLGSRSLSIVPLRRHGQVVGAIGLHDAADIAGARHFLRILANMAALRATDDGEEGSRTVTAAAAPAVAEPSLVCSFSTDLTRRRGLDAAALGEACYSDVSVMVMRFDDPNSATDGIQQSELIDALVCAVQQSAAEQEIPYLKLVGCNIVGAAGFTAGDEGAAARIANTAVASRDKVSALFNAHGLAPNFRLGIDSGVVIGRAVGTEPALFNLWGEAVQIAQTMAAAALPGGIQASEAAYERLRHGFLFRPRGTFYLPAVGRAQTFVLAGRL
jgi:adenylate cyclase